ncbi:DoxX family protein [Marivirga sp. S37H4]|uniref:DoxX family protein n=1 Tax=Marivirga aurantiaca TaxID=2802615 RepID=A0A935C6L0_9BACT|nr:DoxX family protein [Marivirga aurantiaca]MBK6264430.1 DoxX family protein [Marivirga aurantiaca]
MQKIISIFFIVLQLSLGALFVYAGVRKFIPNPARKAATEQSIEPPAHVVQMKAFIGGLKAPDYFWPLLGVVEILAGLLLISQYFALAGAFLLLPVTLNIFLFHLYLKPEDTPGLLMSGLYLAGNLLIILYDYKKLRLTFFTPKPLLK